MSDAPAGPRGAEGRGGGRGGRALLTRRRLLWLLGGGAAALAGARLALPRWVRPGPPGGVEELSEGARRLVELAFEGLDPARCWDVHVHVVGLGRGGSGCSVDPRMLSHWHPMLRLRFDVYLAASGVRDLSRADEEYLEVLLELHRRANPRGKLLLLAFDANVGEDGREDPARTSLHTPVEHVARVAAGRAGVLPVASVHPYRADAIERLERAAEAGAVAVKWLPSAMGIDPAAKRCDPFYERLAALGLPLITHAGTELAVHAEEAQRLGNPLRLRRPLDRGVTVVVAHCASLGRDLDLDAPEAERAERASFDLFLRMLGERQHEGRLWGEISALTLVNRCGRPLRELLLAPELHPRLVNGSDYPLPAVDPLVSARWLDRLGYLEPGEAPLLEEIQAVNPLLFDLVLKRRLRVVAEGRAHCFAPEVFETQRLFGS